jgi:hypothetical protein
VPNSKLKPLKTTFASSHGAPKNGESTTCEKNIIIKKNNICEKRKPSKAKI